MMIFLGCNYGMGKWVADERRPLYSGGHCRKWLSKTWACRSSQRVDFAYEKFRWQPKDCDLEEFQGSKFLQRMRNKTLAFIGDSLGQQQFQSLMCMTVGNEAIPHVIDVGKEYNLVKPHKKAHPNGWAYRFLTTNTTILFYWSPCLCDLVRFRRSKIAMHLDRPPAFLRKFLPRLNVLVLNTGHHWSPVKFHSNHWVIHVGGESTPSMDIGQARNFTIHSVVKWVDSRIQHHPSLIAFYRTISPRHFSNGEWYNGGACDNTVPFMTKKNEIQTYKSSDLVPATAVQGTRVKLLDVTALSELRDEGHVSKYGVRAKHGIQDCLHWCLPGIPDTWNEILFAQLQS
ncbi:hypothetical protein Cgig2_025060 [Carnegiea gigantea]|uniref:Trichome birefringence-like N-terminal domain-containing protein n=1 Tax=Carnegiea gigantea TaxID=171969 RepID=A0A9Q1GL52_9CARY|nr:hypothetical protein Cgig2_025060 [Carnegiea gigantea]